MVLSSLCDSTRHPRRRVVCLGFPSAACHLTCLLPCDCLSEPASLLLLPLLCHGGSMADAWHGPTLHDHTLIIFVEPYESSPPRPTTMPWPPTANGDVPPAHITHGYGADDTLIQVGITAIVDDLGVVPLLGQCLDGNHNGHTAIRQQCD